MVAMPKFFPKTILPPRDLAPFRARLFPPVSAAVVVAFVNVSAAVKTPDPDKNPLTIVGTNKSIRAMMQKLIRFSSEVK